MDVKCPRQVRLQVAGQRFWHTTHIIILSLLPWLHLSAAQMGVEDGCVEVEGAARALTDSRDSYIILSVVLLEKHTSTRAIFTEAGVSGWQRAGLACLLCGCWQLTRTSNDPLYRRSEGPSTEGCGLCYCFILISLVAGTVYCTGSKPEA